MLEKSPNIHIFVFVGNNLRFFLSKFAGKGLDFFRVSENTRSFCLSSSKWCGLQSVGSYSNVV